MIVKNAVARLMNMAAALSVIMKVDLILQKGILYPANDGTADIMNDMGSKSFVVDLKVDRSPQYHRYAMAMLRKMLDMVETDLTFNVFRRLLTIKAGFYTSIGTVDLKGRTSVAVVPDSLSFENMDEPEFKECWGAMHQAFCDKYGKSLNQFDLTEWSRM